MNKASLFKIIFENDTKAGRRFDILLLWTIVVSVVVAMLDSVHILHRDYKEAFHILEIGFTVIFTLEYFLRIYVSPKRSAYIFSFWGFVDLFSIVPTYVSLFLYGYQYLMIVRIIRLLRVFRILKLIRFTEEGVMLLRALKSSSVKIVIFLSTVLAIVILLGTVMYVVENGEHGFSSIPQSIYWAIITVTTVGYGDVVPTTVLGKFISSFAMIIGYAIIAVPTGIVTSEMIKVNKISVACPRCGKDAQPHANYCSNCGFPFNETQS